ncbi:MAG: 16S rRNA (cytosine(1402)-N(4))-methyltransferase RsmH [Bacilli bacterium]|jgi:16S rRNA (cytosine1402-N4)-methyltransferase
MTAYNFHNPVMLKEVLSFVPPKKLTYVDMTLGRAGHASNILKILKKGSSFYGIDRDEDALTYSKNLLKPYEKKVSLNFLHSTFAEAIPLLKENGLSQADFILFDIGVSSPQFDDPKRGFSYRYDAPLDMRMDQESKLTASDIVNTYSEKDLCYVFGTLGQCHIYYPVVKKILLARTVKPIKTTFELVDIIKSSLPSHELNKKGHPAKQFFLGLRYEVNQEIPQLKKGLTEAIEFLAPKGRLVIISFNSEEDKIVKDTFKEYIDLPKSDKYHPIIDEKQPDYLTLTRKPLVPDEEEVALNNRCKPSILRALERKENHERPNQKN